MFTALSEPGTMAFDTTNLASAQHTFTLVNFRLANRVAV